VNCKMHEMSIALSIIDLAEAQARKERAVRIVEVELDIGTISGIEIEALNFAMEVAAKDTQLETARIRINRIEVVLECMECGHRFEPERYLSQCPLCGELNTRVIKGRELQVKSLLIE
jgi:hydrogenase nickel incorporation protein HypA/HybF